METYWRWMAKATCRVRRVLAREDGQGTTEYAILVGVLVVIVRFTLIELLVVIAIIAITVFRPKLQELWDSIADGINAL